jgi:polyisoprenoid-binding protein YceI
LTLNGRTRLLTLEVECNGVQEFPGRNVHRAGLSATGSSKRSEFGIKFRVLPLGVDLLALGDKVMIERDLEFIEPIDSTM